MDANLAALRLLAAHGPPYSPTEREVLRHFSGFGGLSIKKIKDKWPAGIPEPSARSLIDEYYTPTVLAEAVAQLVRGRLDTLRDEIGQVHALEPAAGIGRLIFAENGVRWTAVEYSAVSAQILAAVRPEVDVRAMPFEGFIRDHASEVFQTLGLVVSNPPYSDERGPAAYDDPDRSTRKLTAAQYFVLRATELLRPGGLGVYIVQHSIMSGSRAQRFRQQLLRRAHLAAAFRLPSDLFPGARLVVDVVLLRARGGLLANDAPEDQYIIDGRYFQTHPAHVLGIEETDGQRRGYQVTGTFTGFPTFVEREPCPCVLAPLPRAWLKSTFQARLDEDQQGAEVLKARSLGTRVAQFAQREGAGEDLGVGAWTAIASELREWSDNFGNPWDHSDLRQLGSTDKDVARFLSLFSKAGVLSTTWLTPPRPPRQSDKPSDVIEVCERLWDRNRVVPVSLVLSSALDAGLGELKLEAIADQLEAAGWALDFDQLGTPASVMPLKHYLTGALWRRLDHAELGGDAEGVVGGLARRQAAKLRATIDPLPFEALPEVSPKFGWLPLPLVNEFANELLHVSRTLERREDGYIGWKGLTDAKSGLPVEDIKVDRDDLPSLFIGYLNDDAGIFSPAASLAEDFGLDPKPFATEAFYKEKGKKPPEPWPPPPWENGLPSLTQAIRDAISQTWALDFRRWLERSDARRAFYTNSWNRQFRGWILPDYPKETPLPVGWSHHIKPNWWQVQGALRLIDQRAGLLAYDVGLGKTLTAILMVALGKERGLFRRPVVVVPNTVTWQWVAEIQRALPHFRVGVIGSKLAQKEATGEISDLNDTPEERAQKWLAFQRGVYDIVIVTATAFPRAAVDTEALEPMYREMRDFLRMATDERDRLAAEKKRLQKRAAAVEDDEADEDEEDEDEIKDPFEIAAELDEDDDGYEGKAPKKKKKRAATSAFEIAAELDAADLDEDDDGDEGKAPKKKKKLKRWTERDEARLGQGLAGFLRELNELPPKQRPDPGVLWNSLGVDCLVVDEAQRYKGLFVPPTIDNAVPKFMGSAESGSRRAWQLHARAAAVRQTNGDTGVFLLSATPAKNSPLELYNALSYLSSSAFLEPGINTHISFVLRYCDFAMTEVVTTTLKRDAKMALVGFKHLDELRSIIFRYAAFYNAEQVGLRLPEPEVQPLQVAMSLRQEAAVVVEKGRLEAAIKGRKKSEIFSALANMSLIATHPDLIERTADGEPAWTWKNATQNPSPSSAKFERCATQVLTNTVCNHLIFLQNVAAQWWLRDVLVARGIPEDQILIMNAKTAPRPAQRRRMGIQFTGSDAGPTGESEIQPSHRILIANEVAYEGINLQRMTCAIHHIDIPWEPATLQQRNGRGVRQGNKQDVVAIYYYLATGSGDALRLQQISGKLNWMEILAQGTERDTNNPAAQQNTSGSEMAQFYAGDEQRLEDLKAALEAEAVKEHYAKFIRALGRNVNLVRGLLEDARRAQPVEAGRMRAGAREAWEKVLSQAPSVLLPFLVRASRVIFSRPIRVVGAIPIWPGVAMRLAEGPVELGVSSDTNITLRRAGSAEWEAQPLDLLKPWAVEVVDEKDPVLRLPLASEDFDISLEEPNLEAVLHTYAKRKLEVAGDWKLLGWKDASPEFREKAWEVLSDFVVSRVRAFKGPKVPVIANGTLLLATGTELDGTIVLPWTQRGFERALETPLAPLTKTTELALLSEDWWGRPFRRTRDPAPDRPDEPHPILETVASKLRAAGLGVGVQGQRLVISFEGVAVGQVFYSERLRWLPAPQAVGAEHIQNSAVHRLQVELERCCDLQP